MTTDGRGRPKGAAQGMGCPAAGGAAMIGYAEEFRAVIAAAGLTPPDTIEADGKLRRFASNGKRTDDAGWYILHDDGIPAGQFGCWRSGVSETWRADIGRKLTDTERQAHRAKVAEMRRQREAKRARAQAEAREKAADIWARAIEAPADHACLMQKGIKPHGGERTVGLW